jgi:hypothetical protein
MDYPLHYDLGHRVQLLNLAVGSGHKVAGEIFLCAFRPLSASPSMRCPCGLSFLDNLQKTIQASAFWGVSLLVLHHTVL